MNESVTISKLEYTLLLDAKLKLEKIEEYRREYNNRDDVKEKRSIYMKKRNEKIKKLLEAEKNKS